MKTIIEPFRIKSVEPLHFTTLERRERLLQEAGLNLFRIPAKEILIDLLTDSGTSAMSTAQWAAMMRGDESYAGSESFYRMESVARELTGFRHIIPTHQGRAAERILFQVMCRSRHVVPSKYTLRYHTREHRVHRRPRGRPADSGGRRYAGTARFQRQYGRGRHRAPD